MIEAIPTLNDAMNGLPTEKKAVGTIATFTVIPLACVGIVTGGFLAPGHGEWSLILCGVGGGVLAAAVGLATVFATYRLFGFRAVAGLAAFYVGALAGGLIGWCLTFLIDAWGLLLAPLLGLLNAILRPFARIRSKTPPSEEPLKPGEWRRKKW